MKKILLALSFLLSACQAPADDAHVANFFERQHPNSPVLYTRETLEELTIETGETLNDVGVLLSWNPATNSYDQAEEYTWWTWSEAHQNFLLKYFSQRNGSSYESCYYIFGQNEVDLYSPKCLLYGEMNFCSQLTLSPENPNDTYEWVDGRDDQCTDYLDKYEPPENPGAQ